MVVSLCGVNMMFLAKNKITLEDMMDTLKQFLKIRNWSYVLKKQRFWCLIIWRKEGKMEMR